MVFSYKKPYIELYRNRHSREWTVGFILGTALNWTCLWWPPQGRFPGGQGTWKPGHTHHSFSHPNTTPCCLFGPVWCELSVSVCWSWVMLQMQGIFHPGCDLVAFPWQMKFRRTQPTSCSHWVMWVKPQNYKSRSFAMDCAGHCTFPYRFESNYLMTGFCRTVIGDLNATEFLLRWRDDGWARCLQPYQGAEQKRKKLQ